MSLAHYEKQIPLLNFLINCILARPAAQVLSIKDECIFLFSNFLMIGLCNFSANCCSYIFSFLISLPERFYQNIYRQ